MVDVGEVYEIVRIGEPTMSQEKRCDERGQQQQPDRQENVIVLGRSACAVRRGCPRA